MPGLTWDCTCGALNDASASSCASCGRSPGHPDLPGLIVEPEAPVAPRRALPFSAASGGLQPGGRPINGSRRPVASAPVPAPAGRAAAPNLLPGVLPTSPPVSSVPVDTSPKVARASSGTPLDTAAPAPAPDVAAFATAPGRTAPRPKTTFLEAPEPEPDPVPATPRRRRSAVLSLGFLVAIVALVVAVIVVIGAVNRYGTSKPPNPNQVTTVTQP